MIIRIPRQLRRYSADAAEVDVGGDGDTTVVEALEGLFAIHPDLRIRILNDRGEVFPYLQLFRNGEQATKDARFRPGDTLEIVAAVEGG